MARIVILGAGMMGTAFAWPLVDRGHDVVLVGTHLDAEAVRSIQTTRVHPKLGLAVPDGVEALPLGELARAMVSTDGVVLGVSSAGVAWAGDTLQPFARADLPIAMISKGLIWNGSELATLPDVLARKLGGAGNVQPVAVAGPCIAGELARRVPTSVVFAGRDLDACELWAKWARGPYYHVWTSRDVIGVEVCAALKNAYAMGIAFAAGIHEREGGKAGSIALHNYEAAVFAQSIWEMKRLIALVGGDPEQASWLPGAGDLDVTVNGGRTARFGQFLGQGLGPDEAIRRMQGATLECLEILATLRAALSSYRARGLLSEGALPLAEHLAGVALDGASIDMPFASFFA